jgi:hypothetical protein
MSFALIGNARNISFVEYLRFSANKLLAQNVVWYWGVFKWLGVVLPPIYWRVANRIVLLSAVGLVIYVWRVIKKKYVVATPLSIVYLLLVTVIYALSIFWADWQHEKNVGFSLGIQARYFFPTLVAHMALLMTGILSLGWTAKVRLWLRRGLILLFVWLQLGGLWRLLSVYYDTSSIHILFTQMSQYKPDLMKGNWWYVWSGLYVCALVYLMIVTLKKSPRVHTETRALSRK